MFSYLAQSFEFSSNAMGYIINIYLFTSLLLIWVLFGGYILLQLIDAVLEYLGEYKLRLKQTLNRVKTRPIWLYDMIVGSLIVILWWPFVSVLFRVTTKHIPDSSIITSRGLVPTPFIGDLPIDQYVELIQYLLGYLGMFMLILAVISGTFIAFSFGYKFFKILWITLLFVLYFLFCVWIYFHFIVIALWW